MAPGISPKNSPNPSIADLPPVPAANSVPSPAICESGDVLIFDAAVPEHLRAGDLIATPVTGAYGHSMASNYNKLTRPPVVFVRDGEARLVVRRETWEDLLRCDLD